MRAIVASLGLAAAFGLAAPAQAYTPESGIWWNPQEGGTGIFIEVQDNFLAAAAFVGDANGDPVWYLATNFLTGNARFDGTLDLFRNVQCPGCAWQPGSQATIGAGGSIRLVFDPDDPTRATLTWGNGRTVQYERYPFYMKRPEDAPGVPWKTTMMLGEWQTVMDFSGSAGAFPYYGDVLVLDEYEYDASARRWFYEGCRAHNSEVGGCSPTALRDHSASGYYDEASKLHVIVVDDSRDNWLLYLIETATNTGIGEASVYRKGTNPSGYVPMRSFRTASRTFVETGSGPAKAAGAEAAARAGLGEQLARSGALELQAPLAGSKFDRDALAPVIAQLEARLEAKNTSAIAQ